MPEQHKNHTHKSLDGLLQKHNKQLPDIPRLLQDDRRNQQLVMEQAAFTMDASRLALDLPALNLLSELAHAQQLEKAILALFSGAIVNQSEQRPALHMALRASDAQHLLPGDQAREVIETRHRMLDWAKRFSTGQTPTPAAQAITDIIHIGIGGSDLGSRLLADALPDPQCRPRLHFISAPDPYLWQRLTAALDPRTTAVISTSKSFRTPETLLLTQAAIEWLGADYQKRLFAITSAVDATTELGIPEAQVLPMWPWVGGRFSLWSAAGLMGAIAIGAPAFSQLLAGAERMDRHFQQQPLPHNLPVRMALLDYWQHSIQNYPVRGMFVYDQRLRLVPDWLRQLEMESLGKQVGQKGELLNHATAPMMIGGSGPDAQHAIFQALHQGTRPWPVELVSVAARSGKHEKLQQLQWASMLAQAQALTHGRHDVDDPARILPGGRPVTCWLLADLQPATLGAWLAAYEHKVYALSCLWRINAFDQWGVEEGKRIAASLLSNERDQIADPATRQLLKRLHW